MTIFVSHSTRPGNHAAELARNLVHDELKAFKAENPAVDYFIDVERLGPADVFSARIIEALARTTFGIILISEEALELSSWVHFEAGVMFWRWQFDPNIRLLYVLIDVSRERCHRVFSPHESGRFKDLQYHQDKQDDFRGVLHDQLAKYVETTSAWRSDPAYPQLRDILESGGTSAARGLLQYLRSDLTFGDRPNLFEWASIVLVTAPVNAKLVMGFKNYVAATTNPPTSMQLARHLRKQTTPLEYVARLRGRFLSPETGTPIPSPRICYLSGHSMDLVAWHLLRAFRRDGDFELIPVHLGYDVPSLPAIMHEVQAADFTLQLIKEYAENGFPVFVLAQSMFELDDEVCASWMEEFSGLPVHLLILRGEIALPPPEDGAIGHIVYVDEGIEAQQKRWFTRIEEALNAMSGGRA